MKAIVMTVPGNPDVLRLQDVPKPKIEQPNQILVFLKAAGVNPIDIKLRRRGTLYPEGLPAILGCD
ncbi:MAG: alcohol dehydrogenase, partial [Moorea sp. SIO2B7]|nr:alcohol dehydrogenase [Moorena sp. SIO2B7]